jgi:hypothetical protein
MVAPIIATEDDHLTKAARREHSTTRQRNAHTRVPYVAALLRHRREGPQ